MKEYIPKYNSIPHGFFKACEGYQYNPLLRYRDKNLEKQTLTYKQAYNKVNALAKAFAIKGVKEGVHVAIFSENRVEWFLSDMALLALGAIDVPRGTDSTDSDLKYIVEHSEVSIIIVENETMFNRIKYLMNRLDFVLVLDSSLHNEKDNVYSFDKFLEMGELEVGDDEKFVINIADKILNPDSVATIIYTSGTTGCPKGVVLTHKNILHNIEVIPGVIDLEAGEKFLTVLPIWHIYERSVSYIAAVIGAFTVYTTKRDLKIDLSEEKPDIFVSVPAIWVNIYKSVMKSISQKSFIARNLAMFFINNSIKHIRHKRYKNDQIYLIGDDVKENHYSDYKPAFMGAFCHKMAKKLVYQKLIDLTGGRMRVTVCGGGALPMNIEDFLEACGINLIVGWGITETSPIVTGRSYTNNYRGTCGKPVEYVDIEVRHPNGNKCEDGEMGVCWARGPNIFKEYYKDKELTNKVKIDDYFDTGDLGVYTKQGEIVLTGRAKETIVLLTGENVEPQPIENKVLESNYINQIMLVGQDKPNIGALIILDKENINRYIEKHKINYDNKIKEIRNLIKSEISNLINAKTGFKSYEFISKIKILSSDFSVENHMLTQSLKIKRNEIFERYKNEITEMYN